MKSDLISILRKLAPEDLKKIRLLLRSQYFYNNKNLVLLFEEMCTYYPLFEFNEEDKFSIYRKIYGDTRYNDSTLRSMMHQLLCVVEEFLILQYFRRHDIERDFILLEEFKNRNIDEIFEKKVNKLDRDLSDKETLFIPQNLMKRFNFCTAILNESISNDRVLHKNTIDWQVEKVNRAYDFLALFFYIESVSDFVISKIYHRTCNVENLSDAIIDKNIIDSKYLKDRFSGNQNFLSIVELYEKLFKTFKEFN